MSDSELKKEKRNKGVLKVVGHNLSRACNNVQGHPYDMLKFWNFNQFSGIEKDLSNLRIFCYTKYLNFVIDHGE